MGFEAPGNKQEYFDEETAGIEEIEAHIAELEKRKRFLAQHSPDEAKELDAEVDRLQALLTTRRKEAA